MQAWSLTLARGVCLPCKHASFYPFHSTEYSAVPNISVGLLLVHAGVANVPHLLYRYTQVCTVCHTDDVTCGQPGLKVGKEG